MENKRNIRIFLICMAMLAIFVIVQISRGNPTQEGQATGQSQLKTGIASWYSNEEYPPGSLMANGEVFDDTKLTCASWDYDFGTLLKVTALPSSAKDSKGILWHDDDSKSVVVLVTDRGPSRALYRSGRIIDLSKAAFAHIAPLEQGLAKVQVEVVNDKSRNQKRRLDY